MTRDDWLSQFEDELKKLRPHIRDRVAHSLALQQYTPTEHPRDLARQYDKRQRAPAEPVPPKLRPQPRTDRDAWLLAFSEELQRLRPHLSSRMTWSIGLQAYRDGAQPEDAAQEYHSSRLEAPAPARKGTKR